MLGWAVVLAFWAGVAGGIIRWGGLSPGARAGSPGGAWLEGVALALALVASVMCAVGPMRTRWAAALASAALGLVCALSAGRPVELRTGLRGLPDELVAARVVGGPEFASTCGVSIGSGESVALHRPWPVECGLAEGDELVARAGGLSLSRPWPGLRGGPRSPALRLRWAARRRGPDGLRAGYWRAVAALRERGHDWAGGEDVRGLVVAATLGLRGSLSPAARDRLRGAGLGHLIAVSGLHVGLLALVVFRVTLRAGRGRRLGLFVGAATGAGLIAAYVGLTGAAPPAVRAGAMYCAVVAASVIGRPAHRLFTPAWVMMVLVIASPRWLADPAFQLSAAATWAIVSAPRTPEGEAPGAALVSWRIAWATAGISWWWFGRVGFVAVVVNLVAVPIFSLLMLPFAGLGGVVAIGGGDPQPWIDPALWSARAILDLAALASRVAGEPSPALVLGLGGALWAGSRALPPAARRWLPPAWGLVLLALALLAAPRPVAPALVAVEGGRDRALLVVDGEGRGCLSIHGGALLPWESVASALGVRRVDRVEGEGPVADDLRQRLGAMPVARGTCEAPDEGLLREGLEACRRRVGGSRVLAVLDAGEGREGAPAWRCWTGEGWRGL